MLIKRQKSLNEMLRTLPSGEWHEIRDKDYKKIVVRNALSKLRAKGYVFEATEKGCIDSIKVLRINR